MDNKPDKILLQYLRQLCDDEVYTAITYVFNDLIKTLHEDAEAIDEPVELFRTQGGIRTMRELISMLNYIKQNPIVDA